MLSSAVRQIIEEEHDKNNGIYNYEDKDYEEKYMENLLKDVEINTPEDIMFYTNPDNILELIEKRNRKEN